VVCRAATGVIAPIDPGGIAVHPAIGNPPLACPAIRKMSVDAGA
jgi:hypothetical protein